MPFITFSPPIALDETFRNIQEWWKWISLTCLGSEGKYFHFFPICYDIGDYKENPHIWGYPILEKHQVIRLAKGCLWTSLSKSAKHRDLYRVKMMKSTTKAYLSLIKILAFFPIKLYIFISITIVTICAYQTCINQISLLW